MKKKESPIINKNEERERFASEKFPSGHSGSRFKPPKRLVQLGKVMCDCDG